MLANLVSVIVNWNLKSDTLECINSLLIAGLDPEDIILVDNGSSDGSVPALESQFGNRLQLIKNTRNLGYAYASNQGIKHALNHEAEWIFLLNNDALVSTDIFEIFDTAVKNEPQYSMLSPVIFYHAEPDRIWFLGDHLIPGTLFTRDPYRNKEYNHNLPEIIPVDFINGCGMLVNRKVFEKIGLFDSSLTMYGEEVDLCWRARLAGFQMATTTKAHMWHKVSLSAKQDQPRARYLKIRNQIIFYRRYASGIKLSMMFILSASRCGYLILMDILNYRFRLIKPLVLGWFDGWFTGLEQELSSYGD